MTHNQNKHCLKKAVCSISSGFLCVFFVFTFVDFSIFYVHREGKKIKSILWYCNWQACTVVYATVKYLLYHLYIAKTNK